MARFLPRLAHIAAVLCRRDEGAVAMLFALMSIPVFLALAIAVDYAQLSRSKRSMQDAADAAALAAAKDPRLTDAQLRALAWEVFAANAPDAAGRPSVRFSTTRTGDRVLVEANYVEDNDFVSIGGFRSTEVAVRSEASAGYGKLEVALVLDNTGSMNEDDRIGGLKVAATKMLDTLFNPVSGRLDLKVAIIPFSAGVKVGTQHADAPWMDSLGRSPLNGTAFLKAGQPHTRPVMDVYADMGRPWEGCVMQRGGGHDVLDTEPNQADPATLFVPWFAPDDPDTANWPAGSYYGNSYIADGVALSGLAPEVIQWDVSKYAGAPAGADGGSGPGFNCGIQPMTPLTDDRTVLHGAVSAMTASGSTIIPSGLAWGWHALSPTEPLTQGSPASDKQVRRVIVLMTDGDNNIGSGSEAVALANHNKSWFSSYGYLDQGLLGTTDFAAGMAELDARTATLCENIKKAGITIYTLTFMQRSERSRTLMQACATSPDMFSENPDEATLSANFEKIGKQLSQLRLVE